MTAEQLREKADELDDKADNERDDVFEYQWLREQAERLRARARRLEIQAA